MKNIIIFASGAGSNVAAILEYFKTNDQVKPKAIVCNKPQAGVLNIAKDAKIPTIIIDKPFFNSQEFIEEIMNLEPDLIILAGFLWRIPETLVNSFHNKIINIHPALLPKYGGKGMYGMNVHEAVVNNKEKETGITIHYVNQNYDEGNIILQAHCTVTAEDSAQDLAQKIHQLEHFYFPKTIEFLLSK